MSVDTAAVDRLLSQSRSAHDAKKRCAGVIDRDGRVVAGPNYSSAELHLVDALRCRMEAHDADPEHTASGWRSDRVPDAELIRFYVAYSKPFIPSELLERVLNRFPAYASVEYIP